jgi:hypothetical protein
MHLVTGKDLAVPEELPHVDQHAVLVEASPEDVWLVLVETVARAFSAPASVVATRILGCDQIEVGGPRPLAAGSTIPGFEVSNATSARELTLVGRHRFSRYALIFRIEVLDANRSRLGAETRAVFPGSTGRLYRAAVIGCGLHGVSVRRLLAAVERGVGGASQASR